MILLHFLLFLIYNIYIMGKVFENNNNRGGGNRGGGGRGAPRGGGRGGRGGRQMDFGPPAFVVPYGTYLHRSENCFVVKCTDPTRVPKFNRGVYLESKAKVGTVDEILGPTSSFFFSVKPAEGVSADGFKSGQVLFMNPEDLLPMDRFTKKPASGPRGPRPAGGPGGRPSFGGRPQQGGRPGGPGGPGQRFQSGRPGGNNFRGGNPGGNTKPIQKR